MNSCSIRRQNIGFIELKGPAIHFRHPTTGFGHQQLLRHRLHYRLQRPARRAVERDERAIARWVAEDWP